MRVRRNRFSAASAAIAAALFLAGCGIANAGGTAAGGGPSGPPIVIGASLSLTGQFSADGQAFLAGYKLWQSVVNNSGGLLGRPVQLVILDDKSDPPTAQKDYNTLINVDHVNLVFGPFSSLLTKPAESVAGPSGYALIEGAGDAESVFQMAENYKYRNLFSPSLPVKNYMNAFDAWIGSLPASTRPTSAAFVTVDDPFAYPAVDQSYKDLKKYVTTVYQPPQFPENPGPIRAQALAVVHAAPEMVVLGCTAVPTVQTFMDIFRQSNYKPKVFIATSGPDQGSAFINSPGIGYGNADGMMVPGGWYGLYNNAMSTAMVEQYIARYGGTSATINADVAEAYSVGQVAAYAINATNGVDNTAIIKWLRNRSGLQTVQGPVAFDALGRNPDAVAFVFQWQGTNFVQVLSTGSTARMTSIRYPKPPWGA